MPRAAFVVFSPTSGTITQPAVQQQVEKLATELRANPSVAAVVTAYDASSPQ